MRSVLAVLVTLAACDVEPQPEPAEFRAECPEGAREAVLELLVDLEEVESIAICRAECTREHLDCIDMSGEGCFPACHTTHSECMDACIEPVDPWGFAAPTND